MITHLYMSSCHFYLIFLFIMTSKYVVAFFPFVNLSVWPKSIVCKEVLTIFHSYRFDIINYMRKIIKTSEKDNCIKSITKRQLLNKKYPAKDRQFVD